MTPDQMLHAPQAPFRYSLRQPGLYFGCTTDGKGRISSRLNAVACIVVDKKMTSGGCPSSRIALKVIAAREQGLPVWFLRLAQIDWWRADGGTCEVKTMGDACHMCASLVPEPRLAVCLRAAILTDHAGCLRHARPPEIIMLWYSSRSCQSSIRHLLEALPCVAPEFGE